MVNERPTDQTGVIIEHIVKVHPNLQVVHIDELPSGWLGKLNALHGGTELADGEYLIYAAGDVHFHAQFFKNAVAYAEHHKLDYLSAIPCFHGESWSLRSLIFAFSLLYLHDTFRARESGFGVGVFQVIHASFLDQTPGWMWLKLEIGDDMATAQMCHHWCSRSIPQSHGSALTHVVP